MGCGANKERLAKVSNPSTKTGNTRTATTHQTHVSDTKLESKVPKELNQQLLAEEKSEISVDITAAPRDGRALSGNPSMKVVEPHTAPATTVTSPRSASLFNVVCWCQDKVALRQLAEDPTLEYTPEDSSQTLTFNRYSALARSETASIRISAVVYLVREASDFEEVKAVSKEYEAVWNHFIVAPDELSVPDEFVMPRLSPADNLQKAIHDAYLDLITVIDGFMVSSKSATMLSITKSVHLEISELLDIAGGLDSSSRLKHLREHWQKGRLSLWNERRKLKGAMGKAGRHLRHAAYALGKWVAAERQMGEGRATLMFGSPTDAAGCHVTLKLSASHDPKRTDRDCYVTVLLTPKPTSVPVLANSRLSALAQQTMDTVFSQEPAMRDLFGFRDGKLQVTLWMSLEHKISQENEELQGLLKAVDRLQGEELEIEYKSDRKVSDFIAKKEQSISSLLLDSSVLSAKWRLSTDFSGFLSQALQQLFTTPPKIDVSALLQSVALDLSFESAASLPLPGPSLAKVLDEFREKVREPLECAPTIYQQVKNSLEFYDPQIEVEGRLRNVAVKANWSLPDLTHVLRYNKKFPFL